MDCEGGFQAKLQSLVRRTLRYWKKEKEYYINQEQNFGFVIYLLGKRFCIGPCTKLVISLKLEGGERSNSFNKINRTNVLFEKSFYF